jgi:hypothetical protein
MLAPRAQKVPSNRVVCCCRKAEQDINPAFRSKGRIPGRLEQQSCRNVTSPSVSFLFISQCRLSVTRNVISRLPPPNRRFERWLLSIGLSGPTTSCTSLFNFCSISIGGSSPRRSSSSSRRLLFQLHTPKILTRYVKWSVYWYRPTWIVMFLPWWALSSPVSALYSTFMSSTSRQQ